MKRDVVVIGGGPAGLYCASMLRRALPTSGKLNPLQVTVVEKSDSVGGILRYGFITLSPRWAFPGSRLVRALTLECERAEIEIMTSTPVLEVHQRGDRVDVRTPRQRFECKYAVLATGILPSPEALRSPRVILGLGDVQRVTREIREKGWKRVLLYGSSEQSLRELKQPLSSEGCVDVVGVFVPSVDDARRALGAAGAERYSRADDVYKLPGLSLERLADWDGVVVDYNSFKSHNGSTIGMAIPGVEAINGYVLTNAFGQTSCTRVYACGNVASVISGVLVALSSALTVALFIGRRLLPSVLSESGDRFPWLPREASWEASWLSMEATIHERFAKR